jgi:hypothetical protein
VEVNSKTDFYTLAAGKQLRAISGFRRGVNEIFLDVTQPTLVVTDVSG